MSTWPLVGCTADGHAYQASDSLGTAFSVAWRAHLQLDFTNREKLHGANQVIVDAGHVVLGSLMGKVRSWSDSATKTLEWTSDMGAPIWGAGAADGTNVYFADMWGRVAAFKLSDGTAASGWTNPFQVTRGTHFPFQVSPIIADGKILLGGTDGVFYALDPATGSPIWSRDIGAPIRHTAAWSNATGTGTVVFGGMDGKVYGLNSANGNVIWQTSRFYNAMGFPDYWPLIVGTKVIVRPRTRLPYWESGVPSGVQFPTRGIEVIDFQQNTQMTAALAAYDAAHESAFDGNTAGYALSMYVLSMADGSLTKTDQPIQWYWPMSLDTTPMMPCVDKDGYLILGAQPDPTYINQGGGLVRVSLSTRKVVDGLVSAVFSQTEGWRNKDENVAVAACANGVASFHGMERNAWYTGFYRQTDGQWYSAGDGLGLGNYIMGSAGETLCGSTPVIASGRVYHVANPHTLVAWNAT
jgi:hypothetical protein